MIKRRKTREIKIGNKVIGGKNPILVQSMTNTYTGDLSKTLRQIKKLEQADCEVVRLAVSDQASCGNIPILKEKSKIPLVADIHYDYRLAIKAIQGGADKVRINPGNIEKKSNIKKIVEAAKKKGIPIRIGINAGSLEKELWKKYGGPTPVALVESTLRSIETIESFKYTNLVISIKSSSVIDTISANTELSKKIDYPIHLGITESGPISTGTIRSTSGLSILLHKGIGDTIRVSLTADPVREVRTGYEILKSLELREHGPIIISCPTCGRMQIELEPIVKKVEKAIANSRANIKIAIMGCIVNGPGEARMADVGIAGGKGAGVLFKNGKIVKTMPESQLLFALLNEIRKLEQDEGKRF